MGAGGDGGRWVVGAICVETGERVVEQVEQRDRPTLHSFICRRIRPGTRLLSDFHGGYLGCDDQAMINQHCNDCQNGVCVIGNDPINYPQGHAMSDHLRVNHSQEFVSHQTFQHPANPNEATRKFINNLIFIKLI